MRMKLNYSLITQRLKEGYGNNLKDPEPTICHLLQVLEDAEMVS